MACSACGVRDGRENTRTVPLPEVAEEKKNRRRTKKKRGGRKKKKSTNNAANK
jgi:hypothetical protein